MKDKLNARQKKFAEYYAQSGNTVQSAIKAGYSENYANTNACKLLENVRVSEYIKQLSDKLKDERILSAKDRQLILSGIAKNENHIEDTSDVIKAIDLLNKMTGEYLNKVEVNGSLNTQINKLDKILEQIYDE
ncbi:terminase small subunit [uncultured Ruminococcus sp.]|uniref:terminase small subunit n=1 Tax=uncultured Ruminococcus sp. TaxID=165186 RepID=UPI0025E9638B|nr:terminase small subunit [uncultured Ruminococcus sp.]